jgi:membrane associated rhomboid family serine protease
MHQASVGFHCPECVKGSGQKVYTARNLSAGAAAPVTIALLAVNVATYVVSTLGLGGSPLFDPAPAFVGDWGLIGFGVADDQWYRLVTGGFLHADLMHLGFNMFALWILGRQLEPVLGRAAFGAIYGASLLAGSLGVMVADPRALTVGASGAVFGLFGYALVAQYARGINPMDTGLGGIILINLVFTFVVPGISIGGHLGGLVGGVVAGALHDVVRPRLGLPAWIGTTLVTILGVACGAAAVAVAGAAV